MWSVLILPFLYIFNSRNIWLIAMASYIYDDSRNSWLMIIIQFPMVMKQFIVACHGIGSTISYGPAPIWSWSLWSCFHLSSHYRPPSNPLLELIKSDRWTYQSLIEPALSICCLNFNWKQQFLNLKLKLWRWKSAYCNVYDHTSECYIKAKII